MSSEDVHHTAVRHGCCGGRDRRRTNGFRSRSSVLQRERLGNRLPVSRQRSDPGSPAAGSVPPLRRPGLVALPPLSSFPTFSSLTSNFGGECVAPVEPFPAGQDEIVLCDGKAGIRVEVKNCRFGSATIRIKLSLITPLLEAATAAVAVAAARRAMAAPRERYPSHRHQSVSILMPYGGNAFMLGGRRFTVCPADIPLGEP